MQLLPGWLQDGRVELSSIYHLLRPSSRSYNIHRRFTLSPERSGQNLSVDSARRQIQLNIQKYVALQCTRSHSPKISNYTINDHFLELKHQHSYLGLMINRTMQWSPHINNIATKASKALDFIRRNLSNCLSSTKAMQCLSIFSSPYNRICLLCLGSP